MGVVSQIYKNKQSQFPAIISSDRLPPTIHMQRHRGRKSNASSQWSRLRNFGICKFGSNGGPRQCLALRHACSARMGYVQQPTRRCFCCLGLRYPYGHRGRRFTRGYAGTQHSAANAPRLGGKPPPHPAHQSGLSPCTPRHVTPNALDDADRSCRTDLRPRKGRIARHCGLSVCCGPSHPVSVHDR